MPIDFVHVPTVDQLAREGLVQGNVLSPAASAKIADAMKLNAELFKAASPEDRQAVERAAMARDRNIKKGTK